MGEAAFVGSRFSQIYCKTSEILKDSQRFRVRFATYLVEKLNGWNLGKNIKLELGIEFFCNQYGYDINGGIKSHPIDVVLDVITIAFKMLLLEKNVNNASSYYFSAFHEQKKFLEFINLCFSEENLCYRVDDKGVVHLYPDEEFNVQKVSTLKCLQNPRYNAVVSEFNKAYDMLDSHPQKTKEAIKAIFESLEILCKLLTGADGKDSLGKTLITTKLKISVEKYYQTSNTTIQRAIPTLLTSFSEWVASMQLYRHGQNTTEPNDPLTDLAVFSLSQGSSYLRWLVGIDKALNSIGDK